VTKSSKPSSKRNGREAKEPVSREPDLDNGRRTPVSPANEQVTGDRRTGRDRRDDADRRLESVAVAEERRTVQRRVKVNRRRQIDPTTCERDYSAEEIEFMAAIDAYKRTSGRMFPTCSEMLEVLRKLGYEKRAVTDPASLSAPFEAPQSTCALVSG
jgi:hypothetical protein